MPSETSPKTRVELYPLFSSITSTTDLINAVLVDHHQKVSFVAAGIGQALGLESDSLRRLILAACVHDIGGLTLKARLESFDSEVANPDHHTMPGYFLLAAFAPFADLARIIRFHHVYWQNGRGRQDRGEEVPLLSHIIHLSDRVAVQVDPDREILSQRKEIVQKIEAGRGKQFVPEQVEAFLEVAAAESFWLDLVSPRAGGITRQCIAGGQMELDRRQLLDLAEMFRKIIDFRSRFTATHSSGVAVVAVALAGHSCFGLDDPDRIGIAGLLHDIGKLVVPAEILAKHQPLTEQDFAIICQHPFYSEKILRDIEGFEDITQWVAMHHERLDGKGYPYQKTAEEIPVGARILSVADTFTALMENRPYRCGVGVAGTQRIMREMADCDRLDRDLVALALANIAEINDMRYEAQLGADESHRQFLERCRLFGGDCFEIDDSCPVRR